MRKYFVILLASVAVLTISSCKSKELPSTVAYQQDIPVECVNQDPSGAQTLRVYGKGTDEGKAVENARKTAIETVLFSYITKGTGRYNSIPVIDNQTIRRAHSEYFSKFFKDGGDYKKYVKTLESKKKDACKGGGMVVVETMLNVDRPALIKKMKKDHIIE